MLIALAQINPTVGDLAGNVRRIGDAIGRARERGADLVVLPELCVTGYPPRDLLVQEGFLRDAADAADEIVREHTAGVTVVFGVPLLPSERDVDPTNPAPMSAGIAHAGAMTNSLLAARDGRVLSGGRYDKRLLPTYDVFDESRYFTPGGDARAVDVAGTVVGLTVCEDLWKGRDAGFADRYAAAPDPVADVITRFPGVRLLVNPSASPFVLSKGAKHREIVRDHARRHAVWIASVNQVGGNDELLFDGHSFLCAPDGTIVRGAAGFREDLVLIEFDPAASHAGGARNETGDREVEAVGDGGGDEGHGWDPFAGAAEEELLFDALVMGVRDYCGKTRFHGVTLGLSGGIDSAVTAVIAAAALGPDRVTALMLPSRVSSRGSVDDAAELARRVGIRCERIDIQPACDAVLSALGPVFAGTPPDVAEENLQSRVRGTLLMGVSNKLGLLLLTTGNKSELAVGYCTLYGDMNGGLSVLSDLTKGTVYRLAKWINAHPQRLGISGLAGPPIPDASITKAPSAELRENQTDQDTLPPYDVLDRVIELYVERRRHPREIVRETGFDAPTVSRIVRLIDASEFKRRQAAIGLKVTSRAFGTGRRMPVAQGWRPASSL